MEEEDGQGGWRWGPSTHIGEKEQDPSEQCDELASQPQVVHCGAVRVRRLGVGDTEVLTQPPNSWTQIHLYPKAPNIWIPGSLLPPSLPSGVGGVHLCVLFRSFLQSLPQGNHGNPAVPQLLPMSQSLTVPSSGW